MGGLPVSPTAQRAAIRAAIRAGPVSLGPPRKPCRHAHPLQGNGTPLLGCPSPKVMEPRPPSPITEPTPRPSTAGMLRHPAPLPEGSSPSALPPGDPATPPLLRGLPPPRLPSLPPSPSALLPSPGFLSTRAVTSSSGFTAAARVPSSDGVVGGGGAFCPNSVAPAAAGRGPAAAAAAAAAELGASSVVVVVVDSAPPAGAAAVAGVGLPLPGAPGCFLTGGSSWCSRMRPPQLPT